jgi:hypothetical protein
VDTLFEKLGQLATQLKEDASKPRPNYLHLAHTQRSVELSYKEALRFGPQHTLYFADSLFTKFGLNNKDNFIMVVVDPMRDMERKLSSSFSNKQAVPYVKVATPVTIHAYNKNLYDLNKWHVNLDIKMDKLFVGNRIFAEVTMSNGPILPHLTTYMTRLDRSTLMYTNFQLPTNTKSIRVNFKGNKILSIFRALAIPSIVAFTRGQAIIISSDIPLLILGIANMNCSPNTQIDKVEPSEDKPFQVIRAPLNCDPQHNYENLILRINLIDSVLMYNSW